MSWRIDDEQALRLGSLLWHWQPGQLLLCLTGAGISAESGVPTFRGDDGFWTIGSRNYRPQELATRAMFEREPEAVWAFYLDRVRRLAGVRPNAAHEALLRLERALGRGFRLVTQNVDGLHQMAGSDPDETWAIHGDIKVLRCAVGCGQLPIEAGPELCEAPVETGLDQATRAALRCPRCGGWLRPHVLWFDEFYDEENFHFDSAMTATMEAGLLIVIGTSGATNLPSQIVSMAVRRGVPLIVIDPEDGPFQSQAAGSELGLFLRGAAGAALPLVVDAVIERARGVSS